MATTLKVGDVVTVPAGPPVYFDEVRKDDVCLVTELDFSFSGKDIVKLQLLRSGRQFWEYADMCRPLT